MNVVSRSIANFERKYRGGLPDLRSSPRLIIASDYAGSHNEAPYEAICLLVASARSVAEWQNARERVRSRYLPDGRRISYKGLNDEKKRAALPSFLSAANELQGAIVVVLIHKQLQSLFQSHGRLSRDDPELVDFWNWKSRIIERMLRTAHFGSLLLRGLSAPGQDVLWLTDEDDIVANEQRLRQFVTVFRNISSHYLPHDLGHLRIGSTACDSGGRDIEDLVAIPDLAAGALTDILPGFAARGGFSAGPLMIPAHSDVKKKARDIMGWFSDNRYSLRRVVCVLDEGSDRIKCRVTCLRFHGSTDAGIQPRRAADARSFVGYSISA